MTRAIKCIIRIKSFMYDEEDIKLERLPPVSTFVNGALSRSFSGAYHRRVNQQTGQDKAGSRTY